MRYKKIIIFYLLAVIVGLLTGLVSVFFQWSIEKVSIFFQNIVAFFLTKGVPDYVSYPILTSCSIFSVWFFIQRFVPDASGSGVPEIEGALLHSVEVRWHRVLPAKFIGGVLAIASHLVVGREGPTIQMGGNIGKMFAHYTKLNIKRSDALIAAGSGAGLAAAFNAPLAGVLFVMEEMRHVFLLPFIHFKTVALSCVASCLILQLCLGNHAAIVMPVFTAPSLSSLSLFFILGLIVGPVGILFSRTLMYSLSWMERQSVRIKMMYVLSVSVLIGILTALWSNAVGGGYEIIHQVIRFMPGFYTLVVLFVIRFATTMLSYNIGTPGGIFAPMLALGTLVGLIMDGGLHYVFPGIEIPPGMLAVAGMGALFSSTVRAPITGIVLVVEMTQNYALILPLMVACLTATTVVQLAGVGPIYTQLLRRRLKRQ
jgi:CIC family chloride channel protein